MVVGDYAAMDRVLRDERAHILGLVKKIRACGANVVLVQKSILRDATTDLALHYLAKVRGEERREAAGRREGRKNARARGPWPHASSLSAPARGGEGGRRSSLHPTCLPHRLGKRRMEAGGARAAARLFSLAFHLHLNLIFSLPFFLFSLSFPLPVCQAKILVVRDIERDDIAFLAKALALRPIAHPDHLTPEKLGSAALVEEVKCGAGRIVQVTGVVGGGRTATALLRGSNALVLAEAERSLHDALCVVRCLAHKPALVPGGGAPEAEVSAVLSKWAATRTGAAAVCARAFSDALEAVPYTLAENAGLPAIEVVAQLRARHAAGDKNAGIDARRGCVVDMAAAGCVQPLLVSSSAVALAAECVRMIMKIDDIVPVR